MRITSGMARGISLSSPKGDATRPATDAAREAIFSSLGDIVIDSEVVDLFAGTGSYGLEAASRGAKGVVFVEKDSKAASCLKKNIAEVSNAISKNGRNVRLKVISADCFKCAKAISGISSAPTLVFADPPYRMLSDSKLLKMLLAAFAEIAGKSDTLCILEAPAEFELPEKSDESSPFTLEIVRRLGKKSKGKPSQIIFRINSK